MQHLLHKHLYDLRVSGMDARKLQTEVSRVHRAEVLPALEETFDSLTNKDELLRLDVLELDLGQIKGSKLKDMPALIAKKLFEELHTLKAAAQANPQAASKQGIQLQGGQASQTELIFYYLQKGYLPWWYRQPKSFAFAQVFEEWLLQANSQQKRKLATFASQLNVARRLYFQLGKKQLQALWQAIATTPYSWVEDLLPALQKLAWLKGPAMQAAEEQQAVYFALLLKYSSILQAVPKAKASLVAAIIIEIAEAQKLSIQELTTPFAKRVRLWNKGEALDASLLKIAEDWPAIQQELKRLQSDNSTPNSKAKKAVKNELQFGDAATPDPGNVPTDELLPEEAEDKLKEWLVAGAGIVLLWPFMSRSFTSLGLLQNKQFVQKADRIRAVQLLFYLAYGKSTAEEHLLLLPKVLLGLKKNEVVPKRFRLKKEEKQELQDVLESALEHWEAIKSTRPDGLREAFLQRDGILVEEAGRIVVRIERTGYDVLLDKLPWGLSIVKFPWLDKSIHIEW